MEERHTIQQDEKNGNKVPIWPFIVGGSVVLIALIRSMAKNNSTDLTSEQIQLHNDILSNDFDPMDLLKPDESPVIMTYNDDGFADYESCNAAAEAMLSRVRYKFDDTSKVVKRYTQSVLADLFYIASEGESKVYNSVIEAYMMTMDVWSVVSKPLIDASNMMMQSAVQIVNTNMQRTLQASGWVYLKNTTNVAEFSELKSTTSLNKKSAGGLLSIGNFNLLGGNTRATKQITSNWVDQSETMTITWTPHIVSEDINPDLYKVGLTEAEGLFNVSASLLSAALTSAPSLDVLISGTQDR